MSRTGIPERAGWWARCRDDVALRALAVAATVRFTVAGDTWAAWFAVADGVVTDGGDGRDPSAEFTVAAPDAAWREFFAAVPRPPYQNLFGMLMRVEGTRIEGSTLRFAQSCHVVRRVLELGREHAAGRSDRPASDATPAPARDPVRGAYHHLVIGGREHRVFVEQAGTGRDLLMLHTAGADARQFHHLMAHPELAARCRMVAFDLPWHGRSFPPVGAVPGSYELTTADYREAVTGVIAALGLDRPVVLGCSMSGLLCLDLAATVPDLVGGVVACEASDVVPGRQVPWARHPEVNQAVFVPEWIDGLMAPQTDPQHRQEIWWAYSQGGFGSFFGDILFYSGGFDARDRLGEIDTSRCPVVMLTGEYDYSCTPEMSRRTAERIDGATFRVLPEIGHFPPAEAPQRFASHLLEALDTIEATDAAVGGTRS
jgi:pimeloyl-ACP methyl ester carboxylesterase